MRCRVRWTERHFIRDEIAEMRVLLFADRHFERQRALRNLDNTLDLARGRVQLFGDLVARRFASQFLHELARNACQFVDAFAHVHRHANRPSLISNRARDCLTNPPGRVRRKLVAAMIIEFFDRANQADVAFLNQIEERHTASNVFFRNRDDETKICFDKFLPILIAFANFLLEPHPFRRRDMIFGQAKSRALAGFHAARVLNLLLGSQQGNARNLFEIETDRVVNPNRAEVKVLFRFLRRFGFFSIRARLFRLDHWDAFVEQDDVQFFQLFHVRFSFREHGKNIVLRQVTLVFAFLDQLFCERGFFFRLHARQYGL